MQFKIAKEGFFISPSAGETAFLLPLFSSQDPQISANYRSGVTVRFCHVLKGKEERTSYGTCKQNCLPIVLRNLLRQHS